MNKTLGKKKSLRDIPSSCPFSSGKRERNGLHRKPSPRSP